MEIIEMDNCRKERKFQGEDEEILEGTRRETLEVERSDTCCKNYDV